MTLIQGIPGIRRRLYVNTLLTVLNPSVRSPATIVATFPNSFIPLCRLATTFRLKSCTRPKYPLPSVELKTTKNITRLENFMSTLLIQEWKWGYRSRTLQFCATRATGATTAVLSSLQIRCFISEQSTVYSTLTFEFRIVVFTFLLLFKCQNDVAKSQEKLKSNFPNYVADMSMKEFYRARNNKLFCIMAYSRIHCFHPYTCLGLVQLQRRLE